MEKNITKKKCLCTYRQQQKNLHAVNEFFNTFHTGSKHNKIKTPPTKQNRYNNISQSTPAVLYISNPQTTTTSTSHQ